ncbi:MAG: CARDB domain-containing protein [Candidatus Pacearchaeota archaeon]|jgi:hypothetical protein
MKLYKILLFLPIILLAINFTLAIDKTIFLKDYEIKYSYIASEVKSGDKFSLDVEIKNTGTNKENVEFEINPDNPFDIDDETWVIGNLSEESSKKHTFRIDIDEDIPEGEYSLEFTLDDNKDNIDDEFEIDILSDNVELIIGDIKSSPAIITPDLDNIKLDINIENIGGGDSSFTKVNLILPQGLSASEAYSDSVNLGTIASKGDKTATFYIDSEKDIQPGNKLAKLEFEFKDGVDKRKLSLDFEIPIKGRPLFEIDSYSTSPIKLYQGNSGNVIIIIKNIGQEEGKETSVRVYENSDFPFEFEEKTNFIGNLKPGESGNSNFKINIDDDAKPGKYLLKVQTRSINNNNVVVEEKNIPITIYKKESGFNQMYIIIFGVFILLIIILIVLMYKSKRN